MGLAWIMLAGGLLLTITVGTELFLFVVMLMNLAVIAWILITNHTKVQR